MTKNLRQSFKSLLGFKELVSFLNAVDLALPYIYGLLLQQVPIPVLDTLISNGEDESQPLMLYDHQPLELTEDDYFRVCHIKKKKVQSI